MRRTSEILCHLLATSAAIHSSVIFFFQAEDGIRDYKVTGVQTCALPISKQQVRINASFWYGLSSVLTLNGPYQTMTKAKGAARCPDARAVFDRLTRTKTDRKSVV